jgi:hypothetical protein
LIRRPKNLYKKYKLKIPQTIHTIVVLKSSSAMISS